LVGKYYVKFDKTYKSEIENLLKEGGTEEEAKKTSSYFYSKLKICFKNGKLEILKL